LTDDLLRSLERDRLELRMLDSAEITDAVAAEMLGLFARGFERWPWSEPGVAAIDHLRWKTSGPATRLASYQGRIDGRLVYATTVLANWVRVAGARRLRVVLLDACVDPAMQGRGIYSRALAYRQQVLRYRCDFTMFERSQVGTVERRMAPSGHRALGNPVTSLARVLRPVAAVSHRRGAGRLLMLPVSSMLWGLGTTRARRRARAPTKPRSMTRFDSRFDALFEAAAGSFDLIGERTAEFLAWRYGDPRGGRHLVRELTEGDDLIGYAAVRATGSRAYLADLLALPDRPAAVEALVADAVGVAKASGASVLECWLPRHHPYRAALRRLGFFDRGRDAGISYHAVEMASAELDFLASPQARVHFTLGDTDLV
jgi:hypothetical protein